ncbi:hypothetical protein SAMN05443270_3176 [Lacrimispora sphenoides]|jgi:hypothetical protein|uniref:ABC-three component system middle component 1 n=1 Tax=Lacrimispora sphenoides TaxID=29370 RepID=UPI0008CE5DDB|nr:ABC-three component system middle component 1 [Lacrimispora sphenoides]SEU10357.1 hypothetical protein SAMN05443270_3176 [Lacrimispora sphenoides]
MINILDNIFDYYKYQKINISDLQNQNNILFYKHQDTSIANYFLVYEIDCREFEDDEQKVKLALDELEKLYATKSKDSYTLRSKILEQFKSTQEASQIDKNTSAIYLLLFNNIEQLNKYRNEVYSIEESPNYFKRYVLPYTLKQLNQLNDALSQFPDRSLDEALCQIIDNEDNYFRLVEGKDLESTYGLVIRMFSKLPFLQYKFKTELAPEPIEKQVERNLKEEQINYHRILNNDEINIEEILLLEDSLVIAEDEIDKEIKKRMKGVK